MPKGGAREGAGRPPRRNDDEECKRLIAAVQRGEIPGLTWQQHQMIDRYDRRQRKRASRAKSKAPPK